MWLNHPNSSLSTRQQIQIAIGLGYIPTASDSSEYCSDRLEFVRYAGSIVCDRSRLANVTGVDTSNVLEHRHKGSTDFLVRRSISKLAGFKDEVDMLIPEKVDKLENLIHVDL